MGSASSKKRRPISVARPKMLMRVNSVEGGLAIKAQSYDARQRTNKHRASAWELDTIGDKLKGADPAVLLQQYDEDVATKEAAVDPQMSVGKQRLKEFVLRGIKDGTFRAINDLKVRRNSTAGIDPSQHASQYAFSGGFHALHHVGEHLHIGRLGQRNNGSSYMMKKSQSRRRSSGAPSRSSPLRMARPDADALFASIPPNPLNSPIDPFAAPSDGRQSFSKPSLALGGRRSSRSPPRSPDRSPRSGRMSPSPLSSDRRNLGGESPMLAFQTSHVEAEEIWPRLRMSDNMKQLALSSFEIEAREVEKQRYSTSPRSNEKKGRSSSSRSSPIESQSIVVVSVLDRNSLNRALMDIDIFLLPGELDRAIETHGLRGDSAIGREAYMQVALDAQIEPLEVNHAGTRSGVKQLHEIFMAHAVLSVINTSAMVMMKDDEEKVERTRARRFGVLNQAQLIELFEAPPPLGLGRPFHTIAESFELIAEWADDFGMLDWDRFVYFCTSRVRRLSVCVSSTSPARSSVFSPPVSLLEFIFSFAALRLSCGVKNAWKTIKKKSKKLFWRSPLPTSTPRN